MKKNQKIGFLGGTFNPFHLGHLNLAIEVLEKSNLEKILICPTNQSPFKVKNPPILNKHRREMIKEAIKGISNLKLIDNEIFNETPSYTYETLCQLRSEGVETTLILSDDLLYSFDKWHRAKDIVREFEYLIAKRDPIALDERRIDPWFLPFFKNKILPIRLIDVSSSEIRVRLKNKLYCQHLLPLKTLDYIYKYKLYS